MIEIIVSVLAFLIIIALLGILVWHLKETNKQTEMLLLAIKAKDIHEFKEATMPVVEKDEVPSDIINTEDMDPKTFSKFIKHQNIVSDEE
jgi:hypothetical protein